MYLLIQLFDDYTSKHAHPRGFVISRHKEYFAASRNARQDRAVIESEEEIKVGDVRPDLVDTFQAEQKERRLVSHCCEVLKLQKQGETPDDALLFTIADEGLSLAELLDQYEEKAQAFLDLEQAKKQEMAEQMARRNAVKEEAGNLMTDFSFSFPAVRGVQAGKEFYVAQIPYKLLVKIFKFDDEELPPELRAQRELSDLRADKISDYIIENPFEYVLPALTASVSSSMTFRPMSESGAASLVGTLHIPLDATLLINDGQHRKSGIERTLLKNSSFGDETIAMTLFFDEGLTRSQQIFSDINGNHVKPSAAINMLFDHRNVFNVWIKELLKALPLVARRIEKESSSVGAKSTKYWSIVSFKKFITALTGINEKNAGDVLTVSKRQTGTQFMADFFNACNAIPYWSDMLKGELKPSDVRQDYVVGHAVFLEALGLACRVLVPAENNLPVFEGYDFSVMNKLADIDPLKTSGQWVGRCVLFGSMQKNATGVNLTANQLRKIMGMELTEDQIKYENKLSEITA